MKTVQIKVTGLNCPRCEQHVANELEKIEGVEKAIADRIHNIALVRLSGDDVSEDALRQAVEGGEGHNYTYGGIVA